MRTYRRDNTVIRVVVHCHVDSSSGARVTTVDDILLINLNFLGSARVANQIVDELKTRFVGKDVSVWNEAGSLGVDI